MSQTEWVSVYRIAPQEGSRLNYALNIIDTPGFGDTRGIERDEAVTDQIRQLFSSEDEKGVSFLDAVCFIVKAPDARLTISQKYIFNSIMSLFGKDVKSNICILITFADGGKPPVLETLKEAELPLDNIFQFNNSALFAQNTNLSSTSMSFGFWEMGLNSFQQFFDHLTGLESKSISQTKDVLMKREQLKHIINGILPNVKAGLSKLAELKSHLKNFEIHKRDIENNKNFEYEVEETKQQKIALTFGQHVTNCSMCHITCHEDCAYANDKDKFKCSAMSDGKCKVCDGKCAWDQHYNNPYIFRYTQVKVKRTYQNVKKKYEDAIGLKLTDEQLMKVIVADVEELFQYIKQKLEEMRQCKMKLKQIALRDDPLSEIDYINLLINAEKKEGQPGFKDRILMLEEIKSRNRVEDDIAVLRQTFTSTKDCISSAGVRLEDPDKYNFLHRNLNRFLKKFFAD